MLIFAVRLIVEQDGRILCLKQTKKNGGGYSLIGGNVEQREFARQALAREAREEAGISVEPDDLELVHVLHRHKLKKNEELIVLYFRARKFLGNPTSLEPKKFKDVRWVPLNDLPDSISKANVHVLQCIKKHNIYSEYPSRSKVLAFWSQASDMWPISPEN
jgi:8-oxo-dGTP diphosphatase